MKNKMQKRNVNTKKNSASESAGKFRITPARTTSRRRFPKDSDYNSQTSSRLIEDRSWENGFSRIINNGFQETGRRNETPDYYEPINENLNNEYGEHPSSASGEEYSGSSKRHPGLRNYDYNRNLIKEPYLDEGDYHSDDFEEKQYYRNVRADNPEAQYREYMNRGQFENEFHGRGIYDPRQNKYGRFNGEEDLGRDHFYRHQGHQTFGNVEGFGIRDGVQRGQDWRDEDEYREGHATKKRRSGKFGSR